MTVGTNVKSCYYSVKNAEATLEQLILKTTDEEAKQTFLQSKALLGEVKKSLHEQVLFLMREEPQY